MLINLKQHKSEKNESSRGGGQAMMTSIFVQRRGLSRDDAGEGGGLKWIFFDDVNCERPHIVIK